MTIMLVVATVMSFVSLVLSILALFINMKNHLSEEYRRKTAEYEASFEKEASDLVGLEARKKRIIHDR